MKKASFLSLLIFATLFIVAQPKIPKINWQHISSNETGIDSPNVSEQQTSDAVFDTS